MPAQTKLQIIPENVTELDTTQLDREVAEGKFTFLTSFGAKRFQNPVQERAVELMIVTHGLETFKKGVEWAAKLGMSRGRAVLALEKALPKWGKNNNDNDRRMRQDDASRSKYAEWNDLGKR